ncbi:UDP-N-acetylglucosamine--N-acetylmuramyl-(pentapeptide) pyrophosphoryl-undecaprenol N-acetylglucosamine transferase [Myroides gitamensis]|uniref:UDP-N-acetylglucosamine--N-acetylmuramyl-(pentapeptide) pyrophosphoryl-undecaprenol N-acetylglucosamine transferase n=1 Tax=Myroides odoratus TaxID=256 RepID=A0A378U3P1_MYROD|nr:undecaprenyldiphospho-muramoylpentapeptide beta-N-acetylglucosaminyltransferase [Myroides odoratus]MCS4238907.1 UDP-N-acetylglucosamine--N-acetylmuramyl-(pentapeptide) pyrophosphoryl-undecaprenol N-acetylglucosamine transferase [Myroides odoratus]MDH6602652.1 UDP-N-acetylglucosamine--N-acetylmuramyl-(pentapeptide) pyrophosphoryl-undecaprenol N-acetylglucosamine transferase [Myroides gitamensis]QQU03768.1 undecaprenyldiphospho-muramoylpentapeptide beta-N-acetylglucosaminyltransferase [Myroides
MERKPKFIVSGGGTGGHIFPALAIADELKARFPEADILFVGAEGKMEMQRVPEAGYPIEGLWISGIQRKLTLDNLMFPFKLLSSLKKSRKIVKQFQPDVVIGTGGFASGAVVKVAAGKGIPTLVQEQNSFPGITNKLLGKEVDKICVAYDGLEQFFPKHKIIKTGNPVRQGLLDVASKREEATAYFGLDQSKNTLLVLGGSLGARRINQLIEEQLPLFKEMGIQLIWQCGKFYYEEYKQYESAEVKVRAFLDRMDLAYAAADSIISRAGASSVSELALVGKAVIFIPSPNVAEDHQTKNARSIVEQDAALLIKESELAETFVTTFKDLFNNKAKQMELGQNFRKLALPQATKDIVDQIVELMKK